MSDNSPCFPMARTIHKPNFSHPNGTFRPIRSLEGHQMPNQRFTFREKLQPAGAAEISPKVAGCKRKSSEDDYDVSMSDSRSPPNSPGDNSYISHDMDKEYSAKRTKTGIGREFTLSKLLATLDKPQLLALITNLADAHPNLQPEIASNIPRPTIQSVTLVLNGLEKRVSESFPYTKWGPGKSDYSFNRVKPAIVELKGAILNYAEHFTSPDEFPTTTFSFLHLATCVAHRLPSWENNIHNEIKRDLQAKLADYWKKAIENSASKLSEGKIYGQTVVSEWARHLAQHNNDSNGTFQQAVDAFIQKLGWIIGINGGIPNSTIPPSTSNSVHHFVNSVMSV